MIVVLAHGGDAIARRLAASWQARVVTARDLSTRGWRHYPVGGGDDVLGLGDGPVPAGALRGVWTRIAAVTPADLPHIAADDRAYVAAEMTAFLVSFLRALACPVVNRPSTCSLIGPGWTAPRWRAAAVAAGIPVARPGASGEAITVLGERCFGAARFAAAAAVLARQARVELLTARFTADGELVEVDPWADLPDDAAAAVGARLS